MRHDTPEEIARLLVRHAPRTVRSVLDPAVGSGVLARPFFKRKGCKRIELLDIDRSVIAGLKSSATPGCSVLARDEDFLCWSAPDGEGHRKRFDCVIMNPPFAGRLQDYVNIRGPGRNEKKRVAIEVAFVYRAIRLLRRGGRLLAILPASVVSGECSTWLREFLMHHGSIRFVHELPRLTFAGVEGPVYMLVFERGEAQGVLVSRNHRLFDPEELRISRDVISNTRRLDFRFHEAQAWSQLLRCRKKLEWAPLSSFSTVLRGGQDSPILGSSVLHTTNFFECRPKKKQRFIAARRDRMARDGDIILKRVARNAALSAIVYRGRYPAKCSDCILIVRSRTKADVNRLLFSLRTLIAWSGGAGLVERGVGATYISARRLGSLEVPVNLAEVYPRAFRRFVVCVKKADWGSLPAIEARVRRTIASLVAKK
jgi:hypothetical protein